MSTDSSYHQLATTIANQLNLEQSIKDGTVVFLNGPWGSGKTYFWKHIVSTKLKPENCIYVSLFGVVSVNDLKQKMLSSILSGNKSDGILEKGKLLLGKLTQPFLGLLENQTGLKFEVDLFELISSKKSFTVCFDDFERLPAASSIEEILGFINYLSEHKGFRNMIVMDESQIKKDHKEAFHLLREKLSLRTFKLELDTLSRLKMFLDSYSKTYGITLSSSENDEIINVIEKLKTNNLRTIKFILDCFFQLRSGLQRELPHELIKFLIAMVDFESKGSPQDTKFYQFNPVELYYEEYRRKKEKAKDEVIEPNLQTQFYHKYFGENYPYRMYNCVFEVVKNGYFTVDAATTELFPTDKELTSAERLAAKIKDTHFFFSQDEELLAMESEAVTLIKSPDTMDFSTLYSLTKVLASAAKLLEKGDITNLPENFIKQAEEAVKRIEDPEEIPRDVSDRINELPKLFVDTLNNVCKEERKNRMVRALGDAIKAGKTRHLKEQLIENKFVLEQVFTNGQIGLIWSEAMKNVDKYSLLDTIVKALAGSAHQNAQIKAELDSTHSFLMDQYSKTKSKMHRLRTYRIIEATGLATPTDKPKVTDA